MPRIQCTCGRTYVVPDARMGREVKCAACKRVFVATALPPPKPARTAPGKAQAAAARMRLGDLAVARGMLTREALNACLRHLATMRQLPGQEDLRLGSVLVSKRLLTRGQLNTLLNEQQRGAVAAAVAAVDRSMARPPDSAPVTEAQRETIRRQVEAAKQQLTEKEAAAVAEAVAERRLLARIRPSHVALVLCALLAVLVAMQLRPAPKAQRVLQAYLRSCDETTVAPDTELAITDLGLVIREFRVLRLLPATNLDFAPELADFAKGAGQDWADLLSDVPMSDQKYEALMLLYPALPDDKPPRTIGGLRVWVQLILCHMVSRQRGMGMFTEGNYRLVMLKAQSPTWQCPWKVAGCEPVAKEGK